MAKKRITEDVLCPPPATLPVLTTWLVKRPNAEVDAFLSRPAFAPEAEAAAAEVLADIRKRGDAAVLAAAKRFDRAVLAAGEMRVTAAELSAATKAVPARVKRAVKDAHARV